MVTEKVAKGTLTPEFKQELQNSYSKVEDIEKVLLQLLKAL